MLPTTNPDAQSSTQLLERVKGGDEDALGVLIGRYLTPLRRWAHGRLPAWARTASDTQDVVQDAVLSVLRHLDSFAPERTGALHAYLRTAVLHRIFDEIRQARRRPPGVELDDSVTSAMASPFELAVDQEDRERFEAALNDLREEDRELIIARVEWGLSYEELAVALGKPTAAAARVAVRRAVLRMAEVMGRKRAADRPERTTGSSS